MAHNTLENELEIASYRKAIWFITDAITTGGRKDVKISFVNSRKQLIQDLGLSPRIFQMTGLISARYNPDGTELTSYKSIRDALLTALELGEVGVLEHPWYGSFVNIACREWSINESIRSLGTATITMTFEFSDTDGIPKQDPNVIANVESRNNAVSSAVNSDITNNYSVKSEGLGNFTDAVTKGESVVTSINKATDTVAKKVTKINAFASQLADFTADITSLVSIPQDLADSITNVYTSINGLYTGVEGTFKALRGLFDFGEIDIPFLPTTASKISKQKNNDIINLSIQCLALSNSYFNTSQIKFETVDEIEEVSDILEIQFQKLFASDVIDSDVLTKLTELRITTQGFFDAEKVTAREVVTINTRPTSARLLAFRYYGESTLGDAIGELNEFFDSSLIEGDVKILTS